MEPVSASASASRCVASDSMPDSMPESASENTEGVKTASRWDLYWLGVGILLGGQNMNWQNGLDEGFWSFFLVTILVGSAYFCVALCTAEMASMLPFAGGAYGYVRCALGPTVGFLVGCSEAMKYLFFVSTVVHDMSVLIRELGDISQRYEPALWLIFYALAIPLLVRGGVTFWRAMTGLAVTTALLLAIYCLGATPHVELAHTTVFHTPRKIFRQVAFATWFFSGIDAVTLACSDSKEATKSVPFALIYAMGTATAFALCVLLAAGSYPPGAAALAFYAHPLPAGFAKALGTSVSMANVFILPGFVVNSLGFSFAASRQIRSMAGSGLFPRLLQWSYHSAGVHTPVAALLASVGISFATLLGMYICTADHATFVDEIFHLSLFCSCLVYIALLRAYLVFRGRYGGLERQFTSPLGVLGAWYGMAVFAVILAAVGFLIDTDYWNFYKYALIMAGFYAYYLLVARRTEFFSKEEQEKFMKAYVLNANHDKKRKTARRSGRQGFLRSLLSRVQSSHASVRASASAQSGRLSGRAIAARQMSLGGASVRSAGEPRSVPMLAMLSGKSVLGGGRLSSVAPTPAALSPVNLGGVLTGVGGLGDAPSVVSNRIVRNHLLTVYPLAQESPPIASNELAVACDSCPLDQVRGAEKIR